MLTEVSEAGPTSAGPSPAPGVKPPPNWLLGLTFQGHLSYFVSNEAWGVLL